MSTITIFDDIRDDFKELLEVELPDSYKTSNKFKECEDFIELTYVPASMFNGAYSIQVNAIRDVNVEVNTVLYYNYEVRIQLAFSINSNGGKTSYQGAMRDVEQFIRKRLDSSTWDGDETSIQNIQFFNMNKPKFLQSGEEYWMICETDWIVGGRSIVD